MAATIRDIRDRTGLSLATISKYLNGGNVLPRNRKLIEESKEDVVEGAVADEKDINAAEGAEKN